MMLDRVGQSLERYMDLLSARQKITAANIANAHTPGYKTRDVDFASQLESLMDKGEPAMVEVGGLRTRNDGNNVSVDREARLLAENALRFNMASALLKGRLRAIRSAIQEGRGA
jgi:flagellar basal-body rod protein FlgB